MTWFPTLRRGFATFPDGLPGLGLLLLRASVVGQLGACGYALLAVQHPGTLTIVVVAPLAVAIALSLLLGYLTTFSSLLAAVVSSSAVIVQLVASNLAVGAVRTGCIFTVIMAVALLCLGPGAFSLDARRYGRHEIIIPRRPESSLEE